MLAMQWFQENTTTKYPNTNPSRFEDNGAVQGQQQCVSGKESKMLSFYIPSSSVWSARNLQEGEGGHKANRSCSEEPSPRAGAQREEAGAGVEG